MSYLDLPRLYFAGQFFANPSTINNKLANYSPDVKLLPVSPIRHAANVAEELAGFQYINPYGLHNFCLVDCVVTGLQAADGSYRGADRPLGRVTSGTPYAKMVDLDPDQQSLSQIFGLALDVQLGDGSGFQGRLAPTALFDLWYGRVPSERGDQMAAGCFQSLMPADQVTWYGGAGAAVHALRERCVTGISVKWMLDGYQGNPELPAFNHGRIIGVLGPGLAGEPTRFSAERRLQPCSGIAGPGYWRLDAAHQRVTLDLGNSLPLVQPAGEAIDLGALHAVIVRDAAPDAMPERLHDRPLDYRRAALLGTAGIVDLSISAEQCAALRHAPLGIYATSPRGPAGLILREHAALTWINCEPAWLRLMPGERATVAFHARRAGLPLPDHAIDLRVTSHPINNRPSSGIAFPAEVVTDAHGRAEVEIEARSPRPLPPGRAVIDSQVYYLGGGDWQAGGDLTRQSGGGVLSVLVFNDVTQVEAPTWNDHVGPILFNYARMYPGVAALLGLHDYDAVRSHATRLRACLAVAREDPMHFPPSRDLSPDKAHMICRWIDLGCPP